jgi:hypothetical protein
MDNRINEIRRKISALRSEMAEVEADVRDRLNRGLDSADRALHQLCLRREIARLIGEWKASGGGDHLPDILPGPSAKIGFRPARKDSRPLHIVWHR